MTPDGHDGENCTCEVCRDVRMQARRRPVRIVVEPPPAVQLGLPLREAVPCTCALLGTCAACRGEP